jgi:hypothetical protein
LPFFLLACRALFIFRTARKGAFLSVDSQVVSTRELGRFFEGAALRFPGKE